MLQKFLPLGIARFDNHSSPKSRCWRRLVWGFDFALKQSTTANNHLSLNNNDKFQDNKKIDKFQNIVRLTSSKTICTSFYRSQYATVLTPDAQENEKRSETFGKEAFCVTGASAFPDHRRLEFAVVPRFPHTDVAVELQCPVATTGSSKLLHC
eukprot:4137228-Amphidinium_carterae.1